jgi:hypothetical protein
MLFPPCPSCPARYTRCGGEVSLLILRLLTLTLTAKVVSHNQQQGRACYRLLQPGPRCVCVHGRACTRRSASRKSRDDATCRTNPLFPAGAHAGCAGAMLRESLASMPRTVYNNGDYARFAKDPDAVLVADAEETAGSGGLEAPPPQPSSESDDMMRHPPPRPPAPAPGSSSGLCPAHSWAHCAPRLRPPRGAAHAPWRGAHRRLRLLEAEVARLQGTAPKSIFVRNHPSSPKCVRPPAGEATVGGTVGRTVGRGGGAPAGACAPRTPRARSASAPRKLCARAAARRWGLRRWRPALTPRPPRHPQWRGIDFWN